MGSILDPIARNSEFGWVIIGPTGANMLTTHVSSVRSHSAIIEVEQTLKKIWETEYISNQPNLTAKEKTCENHFTRPHKQDEVGQMEELPPTSGIYKLTTFPDKRNEDVELLPNKWLLAGPTIQDKCLIPTDGEEDTFPYVKKVSSDSFDVDDLMGGSSSTKQAPILKTQLMNKHCLDLRKWDNTNPKVLHNTNFNSIDRNGHISAGNNPSKAPGVQWNSADDGMLFSGFKPYPMQHIKKRSIYDPLCWLAPIQQQWSYAALQLGSSRYSGLTRSQFSSLPAGSTISRDCVCLQGTVTAYIWRFVFNTHCLNKRSRFSSDLSIQELQHSFECPLPVAGRESYVETHFVLVGTWMHTDTKLPPFNPFVDADSLWYLSVYGDGTRLERVNKWPSRLPTSSLITRWTSGSTTIPMEELSTILYKAVDVLISFQLLLMSSNPDGHDVLTSAQFLIRRQITSLPAEDYIKSFPCRQQTTSKSFPGQQQTTLKSFPC
ncbi:unnamed protein product [Orchesella dallaii]|uniref:Uncharacterized protein n=1 Tax=Orchesella dallaii TaxID=48710 RepID=A0ABP1QW22_9HEXA